MSLALNIIINFAKLCFLWRLSIALECATTFQVDNGITDTTASVSVECQEKEGTRCGRIETTTIMNQFLAVAGCMNSEICNTECETVFRSFGTAGGGQSSETTEETVEHVRNLLSIFIQLTTSRKCEFICCDTDNCNNGTVEEIWQNQVVQAVLKDRAQSVPFRFYSSRSPSFHIGSANGRAKIVGFGTESFRLITPGLDNTPESISFHLEGKQGHFLRTQGRNVIVQSYRNDGSFESDATFIPRFNHFYKGYTAYEPTNNRNNFISYGAGGNLLIARESRSRLFRTRAGFRAVKSVSSTSDPMRLHSLGNPTMCVGSGIHFVKGRIAMLQDCRLSLETFRFVSPGLDGTPGSVSILSSSILGDQYLCHDAPFLAYKSLEDNAAFQKRATFIPHRDLFFPGYISFESVNTNMAFNFITVQGGNLILTLIGTDNTSRKNACFAGVNV